MSEKVVRAGISLPKDLMDRFDEFVRRRGFSSRSQAIGEAIRILMTEYEWEEGEGAPFGVIVFLYDHEIAETAERLLEVEHEYIGEVISTLHVHVDERTCLEVTVVKGDPGAIEELAKRISRLRGVKVLKLFRFRSL